MYWFLEKNIIENIDSGVRWHDNSNNLNISYYIFFIRGVSNREKEFEVKKRLLTFFYCLIKKKKRPYGAAYQN